MYLQKIAKLVYIEKMKYVGTIGTYVHTLLNLFSRKIRIRRFNFVRTYLD